MPHSNPNSVAEQSLENNTRPNHDETTAALGDGWGFISAGEEESDENWVVSDEDDETCNAVNGVSKPDSTYEGSIREEKSPERQSAPTSD